jgi:flavodoxin
MKKLFIYYSLSGNGDIVAGILKEKGIDIRKIETRKKMPKSFALQLLVGGFQAGIHYKSKLKEFDYNIDKYDEIIIGSPIWNGNLTPAINTLLSKLDFNNKELKFIFYSGSGTSPKATKIIHEKYPKAIIIDIKSPKNNDNLGEVLKEI